MQAAVYDIHGASAGKVDLNDSVFGAEVNESLLAQAVRVYLANQRQGNAHTKGRGDVTGSTRKIYKQKGTGNARHGDIKAPVFVGGGIVHGPVAHSFRMAFPQKMKSAALRNALSSRAADVSVVTGLGDHDGKAKTMSAFVKKVSGDKKKPLLVLSEELTNAYPALRNLDNVDFVQAQDLNAYEVLNHDCLLIAKEALSVLEKRVGSK